MASILHQIAQNIGMDKAIAYTSGARIVQGISGVGTMFSIHISNRHRARIFILHLEVYWHCKSFLNSDLQALCNNMLPMKPPILILMKTSSTKEKNNINPSCFISQILLEVVFCFSWRSPRVSHHRWQYLFLQIWQFTVIQC